MIKADEVRDPYSCFNRSAPDEWLFVLLARDQAAPVAIRAWVDERIRLKLNKIDDRQIQDALQTAARMEQQRAIRRGT